MSASIRKEGGRRDERRMNSSGVRDIFAKIKVQSQTQVQVQKQVQKQVQS